MMQIRTMGSIMITTITKRIIQIWDGKDWCKVVIDIDVPIEEIRLNSFSQLSKWFVYSSGEEQ